MFGGGTKQPPPPPSRKNSSTHTNVDWLPEINPPIQKTITAVGGDLETLFNGYAALLDSPAIRQLWFREGRWTQQGSWGIAAPTAEAPVTMGTEGNAQAISNTSSAEPLWSGDLIAHIRTEVHDLINQDLPALFMFLNTDLEYQLDHIFQEIDLKHLKATESYLRAAMSTFLDLLDMASPISLGSSWSLMHGIITALHERCKQMLAWLEEGSEEGEYGNRERAEGGKVEYVTEEQNERRRRKQNLLTKRLLATIYDSSIPFPFMDYDDPIYEWRTEVLPQPHPSFEADSEGASSQPPKAALSPKRFFGIADHTDIDGNRLRKVLLRDFISPLQLAADLWADRIAVPLRAVLAGYEAASISQYRCGFIFSLFGFCKTVRSGSNARNSSLDKLAQSVERVDRMMAILAAQRNRTQQFLDDLSAVEQDRALAGEQLVVLASKGYRRWEIRWRDLRPYSSHQLSSQIHGDEIEREDVWLRSVIYDFPRPQALAATLRGHMVKLDGLFNGRWWWERTLRSRDYCERIWRLEEVRNGLFQSTHGESGGAEGIYDGNDPMSNNWIKQEIEKCRRIKEDIEKGFLVDPLGTGGQDSVKSI